MLISNECVELAKIAIFKIPSFQCKYSYFHVFPMFFEGFYGSFNECCNTYSGSI